MSYDAIVLGGGPAGLLAADPDLVREVAAAFAGRHAVRTILSGPAGGVVAARAVGGWAIRNMGTVGGNIFAPPPAGDVAVALLALDAAVKLVGSGGERVDRKSVV